MTKEEKLDRVLEEVVKLNKGTDIIPTVSELELLTEEVTKEEVKEFNPYLTDKYFNVIASFGCTSYKELYEKSLETTDEEKVEKNKNYSSLSREKREVTRDGSTFETTLYIDPKLGIDNKLKARKSDSKIGDGTGESVKTLQPVYVEKEELKTAHKYVKDLNFIYGEYNQAELAKLLVDEFGIVNVSMGFKVSEDGYGEVAYIATNGIYTGVMVRAFFEAIRFCLINQLDCRIGFNDSTITQRLLVENYEFIETEDGKFEATYKTLESVFGEWGK